MGKRKGSYAKTPARVAASRANLAKAWMAPDALVYRPTVRRLLASRANLLKALRAKEERLADGQEVGSGSGSLGSGER